MFRLILPYSPQIGLNTMNIDYGHENIPDPFGILLRLIIPKVVVKNVLSCSIFLAFSIANEGCLYTFY
jgi:hypothetical protein